MSQIEIIGFVFGIAGVWLTIKENLLCFPVGLINVIVSLILFFQQKLYSDAIQQMVYIFLLSYGWYKWISGRNIEKHLAIDSKKIHCLIVVPGIYFSFYFILLKS